MLKLGSINRTCLKIGERVAVVVRRRAVVVPHHNSPSYVRKIRPIQAVFDIAKMERAGHFFMIVDVRFPHDVFMMLCEETFFTVVTSISALALRAKPKRKRLKEQPELAKKPSEKSSDASQRFRHRVTYMAKVQLISLETAGGILI